jgi:hypothetical protein
VVVGKAAQVLCTRLRSAAFKTLAASTLAATVVASLATPASAAPTATISRNIYLAAQSYGAATNPPGSDGDSGARHIYLAAGTYTFGYTLSGPNGTTQDSRPIYLAAGWYYWNCILSGTGGVYPGDDNYDAFCVLYPTNGDEDASVPASANPGVTTDHWDLAPGDWSWVGYLTPHF